MAWHKKAQSEDVFWFAFFYFPLMVAVVMALVIMPRALMGESAQQVALDEAVQARQLHSRLWQTNQYTGRTSPFLYNYDLTQMNKTITKKLMTYRIEIGTDQVFYDKQLYDIAKPIAPYRYLPYKETRTIDTGIKRKLTIEQYYPKKYETKP